MKKVVVLVVMLLLAAVAVSHAADLKSDWYAKIYGVQIYAPNSEGIPTLRDNAYFYETPLGQYNPFLVTDGPYHNDLERDIYVQENASNVGSDKSLILPMYFGMALGDEISYLEVAWATNYDANQMKLELWRERYNGASELMWTQEISDVKGGSSTVAQNTMLEGQYYFKLNVASQVPEPSALITLLAGIIPFTIKRWR